MSKWEDGQNPGIPYDFRKEIDEIFDDYGIGQPEEPWTEGPYCIIEPSAKIGNFTVIGPYTHIMANTVVGEHCHVEGAYLEGCKVGDGTRIYRNTHIMHDALIGRNCLIGHSCFIADGSVVGDNVRMMLNAGIGRCTYIGDDVYIGPNVVLSNSDNSGQIHEVHVEQGAWIGTNAVTTDKVRRIGKRSVIGAGSVVTEDVPAYAVVVGNPAKIIRWNTVDGKESK